MSKRKTFFLVVCLAIFVLEPIGAFASIETEFLLQKEESVKILDIAQKEVSRLIPSGRIFLYSPQEQAALTIFRSTARGVILDFLPGFVSTETVKIVLKSASLIQRLSEATIRGLLSEIEKASVEKAVEIGTDWLFQNELRTGSGIIDREETSLFQYLIVYKSLDKDIADVLVELYSAEPINAPPARTSASGFIGFVGDSPSSEDVEPFIIRIQMRIHKMSTGFTVDTNNISKITIEFPEKVPRLQLAKELPYPIEEQKINLLNKLTAVKKILDALGAMGIEAANTLGKGVDLAKGITEDFFYFFTNLISRESGAGLVEPINEETLNLLQEINSQLVPTKDEFKPPKKLEEPMENLTKFSFPQEESNPPPQIVRQELSQAKDEPVLQENQEKLIQTKDEAELSSVKEVCEANVTTPTALGSIVINEVGWMGTPLSSSDEWIVPQTSTSYS